MKKVAQFQKVSFEEFNKMYPYADAANIYQDIILPRRATVGSAGYDFFMPYDVVLKPGQTVIVPSGIRCKIDEGYVLNLYPRSGFGFKYRLHLDNTVGIIDSDYFYALNEGHIIIKITNGSLDGKIIEIKKGTAFVQGLLQEFFITYDDEATEKRIGGFGSTSK